MLRGPRAVLPVDDVSDVVMDALLRPPFVRLYVERHLSKNTSKRRFSTEAQHEQTLKVLRTSVGAADHQQPGLRTGVLRENGDFCTIDT